jgi:hypothetical protein
MPSCDLGAFVEDWPIDSRLIVEDELLELIEGEAATRRVS